MIELVGVGEIKPTIFPDKTSQVWQIENLKKVNPYNATIIWKFEKEDEFLHVAQLVDLIKAEVDPASIILVIPYLPYARQDKLVSNNTTFALTTFSRLLNTLDVTEVVVNDPHNALKTQKLIQKLNTNPSKLIGRLKNVVITNPYGAVCYPDEGASVRYKTIIGGGIRSITLNKSRNQQTGILEYDGNYTKVGAISSNTKTLVVDDICDGGATFIKVADILKNVIGITEYDLYVTHGIFSKGLDPLFEAGYKTIYTLDNEFNREGSK